MGVLRAMTRCGALLALWLASGAALAQDTAELQPYFGMRDQFEISLPSGWSVYDQALALTGRTGKTGPPVVFSSELIDGKAMMSGKREVLEKVLNQLAGVEVGRIPGFLLDRLPAKRGMTCTGFDSDAQKMVLGVVARDPMFGPGRTIREAPHAEQVPIGGCNGLRLRGKGTVSTGDGKILDVFAVSDGEVVFFFKLLNLDEHYARNVGTFEKVVSTVRLTAAPKSGS